METVSCNNCGGTATRVLFTKKDKHGIAPEPFAVVECTGCGLRYINPRPSPDEMGPFYPDTYSWKETLEDDSALGRTIRSLEKAYRYHLLKHESEKAIRFTGKRGGRVLDVGCGTGDRLDVFRTLGFEPYGVETSGSALYARDHLGLDVFHGDLFGARFPDRFFDLVTLYNVLEHTHDPRAVSLEVSRILKEDGYFILQIPNTDSLQCRLFGKRWAAYDVPRDLYYVNVDTLVAFLGRSSFKVEKVDHFMPVGHPPTLVISLFPSLDPQKAWRRDKEGESSVFERLAWGVCTLLASPLTLVESSLRRGAIVTCFAVNNPMPDAG